jgi:hypothetical protein
MDRTHLAHDPRRTPSRGPILALTAALLTACGGSSTPSQASPETPAEAEVAPAAAPTGGAEDGVTEPGAFSARVEQMITVLTPPPPEAVSSETDDWLEARRSLLDSLSPADADLGQELIQVHRTRSDLDGVVRHAMIEAIARCKPPEGGPYLAELVETYGLDLGVRTAAVKVLHLASPELATETLEPLLRQRPRATYPPAETILLGWLAACDALEKDPVEVLALVATDLYREDAARHQAVRALGRYGGPQARAALETLLTESTGNFYLRRLTAQSVVQCFEPEAACALLERVLSREADQNMQVFLANLVTLNCH